MATDRDKLLIGGLAVGALALGAAGDGDGTNGNGGGSPTAQISVTADHMTITADASASTDPDGDIERYVWEHMAPDASWTNLFNSGETIEFEAQTEGIHRFRVTVEDSQGNTDTAQQNVTASRQQPPTASLDVTTNLFTISVDASQSSDRDGTIEGYEWEVTGPRGNVIQQNLSGPTGSLEVEEEGAYTVYVTVTDSDGLTDEAQQSVTIRSPNTAPSASLSLTPDNLTVAVDATGSSDPDGDSLSYSYVVEDSLGNTFTPAISGPTGTFTVESEGSYTVTVTVMDSNGATDQASESVTLRAPNEAPTAEICSYQLDFDMFADGSIQWWVEVDGSCSTDPNNDITDYRFELVKNGFVVDDTEGPNATNILWLDENGDYTIFLTVTDEHGAGDSDNVSFSFNNY